MVNKVKTRNMFQDIGTGLKSLVGGEIKNLSRLTAEMRNELIQMATDQVYSKGI